MSYYRCPRTGSETRSAASVEDREFIRGARSFHRLPNAWDDIAASRERCWKAQRRSRKAWERM